MKYWAQPLGFLPGLGFFWWYYGRGLVRLGSAGKKNEYSTAQVLEIRSTNYISNIARIDKKRYNMSI